jgi:hypothetical protein
MFNEHPKAIEYHGKLLDFINKVSGNDSSQSRRSCKSRGKMSSQKEMAGEYHASPQVILTTMNADPFCVILPAKSNVVCRKCAEKGHIQLIDLADSTDRGRRPRTGSPDL